MFIMLSNVGWIVKDMMAQATWKGLKVSSIVFVLLLRTEDERLTLLSLEIAAETSHRASCMLAR